MSRLLIAFVLILSLGLSVTGCGGEQDAIPPAPPAGPDDARIAAEAKEAEERAGEVAPAPVPGSPAEDAK